MHTYRHIAICPDCGQRIIAIYLGSQRGYILSRHLRGVMQRGALEPCPGSLKPTFLVKREDARHV